MTHYIPAFTTRIRGQQRAACGEWTDMQAHSCEPTCPTCAAWLTADAADCEETAKALEAQFPEYAGRLVTR